MLQTFEFPGRVPSKKNSYRANGRGGLYKPKNVIEFEREIEKELIIQKAKPAIGSLVVRIEIQDNGRSDIDNQATSLLDALQSGGLFPNDREVIELQVKRVPLTRGSAPRALVEVVSHDAPR